MILVSSAGVISFQVASRARFKPWSDQYRWPANLVSRMPQIEYCNGFVNIHFAAEFFMQNSKQKHVKTKLKRAFKEALTSGNTDKFLKVNNAKCICSQRSNDRSKVFRIRSY